MTSIHRFTVKVIAVHQLTHDVRQIDLRLVEPPEIRFKAGQFVSFMLTPAVLTELEGAGFQAPQ